MDPIKEFSKILMIFLLWGTACKQQGTEEKSIEAKTEPAEKSVEDLKLSDYEPVSIYNIQRTEVEKAKYPVIDMHSHPYAKSREELDQWVITMDEAGIDKTVVMTYATGRKFDSLYTVYSTYPDRFILFCGFDYTGYDQPGFGPAAVRELERCVQVGARGVGELGDKGEGLFYSHPVKAFGMHPDDPRMDPLFTKCAELGIPVNIHVADPKWMYEKMDKTNDGLMNAYKWRLDNKPGIVDHGGMIQILEKTVKRHPETTFIACHYANCSYDLGILGRLFDKYPNLYADISARFAETAPIPNAVNDFYTRYQDRLVYGTDMGTSKKMYRITFRILETDDEHFYEHDQFSYHWALSGYGLDDQILEKVYRKNALAILNR